MEIITVRESKDLSKLPPPGKNYLFFEKSLYLKQHEDNPTMWHPWCKEAFEKAKYENKLIFVSIGYSTCHWCHVMERESFSNREIAELINRHFIPIKIDREERPDLDRIFMSICEVTIRNCGWPLNVILTPDGFPIFVATYIPPESRGNIMGMKELIPKIVEVWEKEKEKAYNVGRKIIDAIKELKEHVRKSSVFPSPYPDILEYAFSNIKEYFDPEYGGFGFGMKFPNATTLLFLMSYYKRRKNPEALYMVEKTLQNMCEGGIYDHIGGGFHRYTVDRRWFQPHFEKMLYDQAMMIWVLSSAYQLTKNPIFKDKTYGTVNYILENLHDKTTGGFFTSQDAESNGEEGKYYLWTHEEIKNIIKDDLETEIFERYFGISPYGNCPEPGFSQKNIIHIASKIEKLEKAFGLSKEKIQEIIRTGISKLKAERDKRIPPHIDTKILTDTNSLMVIALSRACGAFKDQKLKNIAKRCIDFILQSTVKDGEVFHAFYDGEIKVLGTLEDYASVALALFEIYFTTFEEKYLEKAMELSNKMIEKFWGENGFSLQQKNSDFVFIKIKDLFDSAVPSAVSSAILALLYAWKISGEKRFKEIAEEEIKFDLEKALSFPVNYAFFFYAVDFYLGPTYEIVFTANSKEEAFPLIEELLSRYVPQKIILLIDKESKDKISKISPFVKEFEIKDESPKVFVCQEGMCKTPATDKIEMLKNIGEM